jgi:hypothetical protein
MWATRLWKYPRCSRTSSLVMREAGKRAAKRNKARGPRCLRWCKNRGNASLGRLTPACSRAVSSAERCSATRQKI